MTESSLESIGMNLKMMVELFNDTSYERWSRDMMILIAMKGLPLIVDGMDTYPASTTQVIEGAAEAFTKEQLKWKS